MKHLKIFLTVLVLSSFSVEAQNKTTAAADKHFAKLEFVEAAQSYTKLVEKGEADAYVYGQLAEANYNMFNTLEAERWYAKALKENSDPEMCYKYAQMLKANGKYEASNTQMQRFASLLPSDPRALAFKANPNYIEKLLAKAEKFSAKNLEFNSEASDFGGITEAGKLYITSARNNSRKNYGWNAEPFLDLYELSRSAEGSYDAPKLLNRKINTRYHEGLVSFTPDGQTMYFSRESFFENIYEKDTLSNTKISVLHLYKATQLEAKDWGKVEALSLNNKDYSIKNPSVSKDGKTLYFASDMPGGFGHFDLYKAEIDASGQLGSPMNLGNKINTPDQEMFPYIGDDNILYFSSNGHLGLGGLDVFFAKLNDAKAPIRNVGLPVNSNADDFAFNIDGEGNGFVSSNRSGGKGSDDIYQIEKIKPLCDVDMLTVVKDSETGAPLSGAVIQLSDASGMALASANTDAQGQAKFNIECEQATALVVSLAEYEDNTLSVSGTTEEALELSVALDPIKKIIVADRILLEPIYFEYDRSRITERGALELDKLVQIMKNYPDMVIRANSHTDSRGDDKYNERLSTRRAKSTVAYVISQGIDLSRISGEGMGENAPLFDCGKDCTEDQHQLNRRSEFIIVSGGPQ